MSIAESLVQARDRLGLTQAETAGLLGTRQANVSAYERGRLQVGQGIRDRIESFTELGALSSYAEGWPATLASTAAALRADFSVQADEVNMLRLIIQAADDFARLSAACDRRFFLSRPGATGSARWDALLGALAVELCRRYGLESTPAWTRQPDRYLVETWWVGAAGEVESLRALALRDSPPAFRARGVMMGRQMLESM
jgi:transcriptional regulator with XRE-family HTH domain